MVVASSKNKENPFHGTLRQTRSSAKLAAAASVSRSRRTRQPLVDQNGSPTKEPAKSQSNECSRVEGINLKLQTGSISHSSPSKSPCNGLKTSGSECTDLEALNKRMISSICYANDNMHQARLMNTKEFSTSKFNCTKYFNILYKIQMIPETSIISLHLKHTLKLLETINEKHAFNALKSIYDHLPILRVEIRPYDMSEFLSLQSISTPTVPVARAIVSFQSIVLKILEKNTGVVTCSDTSLLQTFKNDCKGNLIYWIQFLSFAEQEIKLFTAAKFAYSFISQKQAIAYDLMILSTSVWMFTANCKLLKNTLQKSREPAAFIQRYGSEINSMLRNIVNTRNKPLDNDIIALLDLIEQTVEENSIHHIDLNTIKQAKTIGMAEIFPHENSLNSGRFIVSGIHKSLYSDPDSCIATVSKAIHSKGLTRQLMVEISNTLTDYFKSIDPQPTESIAEITKLIIAGLRKFPEENSCALSLSKAIAVFASSHNNACYLSLAVELDEIVLQSGSRLAASLSNDVVNHLELYLSKSFGSADMDVKLMKKSLILGFDLLNRLFDLEMLSKTRSLEEILENNKIERFALLTAQILMYQSSITIQDFAHINMGKNIEAMICELVLSVLWRSKNDMKSQIAADLIAVIFSNLHYQEHPIRCVRAVCYYYNATNGKLPTIDGATQEALLNLVLGDLAEDDKLSETRGMVAATAEIILCVADSKKWTPEVLTQTCARVVTHIKEYYGPTSLNLPKLLLRQIDIFLDILFSTACYRDQCVLLKAILSSGTQDVKYRLDLAEVQLFCGLTHSAKLSLDGCLDHFSRMRSMNDNNQTLLFARFLLLNADICLSECNTNAAYRYLGELETYANGSNLSLATSVDSIRTLKTSAPKFHGQVTIFCHGILTHSHYKQLKGNTKVACQMSNDLLKFIFAFLKSAGGKDEGSGNLKPIICILMRAISFSAVLNAHLGLAEACKSRIRLIDQALIKLDPMWKWLAYSWSGPFGIEAYQKSGQLDTALDLASILQGLYGNTFESQNNTNALELARLYAFSLLDTENSSLTRQVKEWTSPKKSKESPERLLSGAMKNLRLDDSIELGIIRARTKISILHGERLENTGSSAEKLLQSIEKGFGKHFEGLDNCAEYLLLELSVANQFYIKATRTLNKNPMYTGIDSDMVMAIPCVSRPITRAVEASKYLSDAIDKISSIATPVMNSCDITAIDKMCELASDIAFVKNAISRNENDHIFISLREVPRDYPYSQSCRKSNAQALSWLSKGQLESSESTLVDSLFDPNTLPEDWVVISLCFQAANEALVATRFANAEKPISLRLPKHLHRDNDYEDDMMSFGECITKVKEIVQTANVKFEKSGHEVTQEDKENYWQAKIEGEQKLRDLMDMASYSWIGGFRALFGSSVNIDEDFIRSFDTILSKHLPSRQRKKGSTGSKQRVVLDSSIYRLFAMAATIRLSNKLPYMGREVEDATEDDLLTEDIVRFLLDTLMLHGEQNPYDELDIDQLCMDIEEFLVGQIQASKPKHTVLVVDKICHEFPWESLPFLVDRSVSRVPSLGVLQRLLAGNPRSEWKVEKVAYIIDPGNDLPSTRVKMENEMKKLSSKASKDSWRGLIGSAPSEGNFVQLLDDADLYLYMGHGGGKQYVKRTTIEGLRRCPPAMLFGCRSSDLESENYYESSGNQLTYLSSGCPMLLCTLFAVTDKDTDNHTCRILESWLEGKNVPITKAINASRKQLRLPYLNGAAFVVYGLPLTIAS